jgi:hypothetical protein
MIKLRNIQETLMLLALGSGLVSTSMAQPPAPPPPPPGIAANAPPPRPGPPPPCSVATPLAGPLGPVGPPPPLGANAPSPGPLGPPLPAANAPAPGSPGPVGPLPPSGALTAPAPPTPSAIVTGTVRSFNYGLDGQINGVVLSNGTAVYFPPELGAQVANSLAVNERVRVTGWPRTGPAGNRLMDAEMITNRRTGVSVTVTDPPRPPAP